MNTEWIKTASNEELLEEFDLNVQRLNKTEVFTTAHRECYAVVKLLKEEILNRMNKKDHPA